MCGTGVTAVVLDVALEQAGIAGNRKVYDGSWTSVPYDKTLIPYPGSDELILWIVNGLKGWTSPVD